MYDVVNMFYQTVNYHLHEIQNALSCLPVSTNP